MGTKAAMRLSAGETCLSDKLQYCCRECLKLREQNQVTTCQEENQAVQNNQKVVNKAPSGSKEKAFTPNLDDGDIGGGPGGGDDGGGGGGGGGFLFWGLLMLIGFIRDNEQDKPYRGRKANKKALKAKRRPQLQA